MQPIMQDMPVHACEAVLGLFTCVPNGDRWSGRNVRSTRHSLSSRLLSDCPLSFIFNYSINNKPQDTRLKTQHTLNNACMSYELSVYVTRFVFKDVLYHIFVRVVYKCLDSWVT